jgi:hypothetical protein
VSEHSNEPTSADTGSIKPAVTEATPVMAESPAIAPDQELTSPQADAPKVEAKIEPKVEAKVEPKLEPKAEAPKAEAPKAEAPKVEAPKVEAKAEAAKPEAPRATGKVMIMSPGDRSWSGGAAKAQAEPAATKARVPAMAAVIAIAAVAGALGGALITASLGRGGSTEVAAARNVTVEAAIARLDADVLALKASVEQTSKTGVIQFNKTSDRLDKVEKAQGEPAARLAKLSDEVSKLRAAQAAAVTPAAAPVAAAAPVPVQQVAAVPAAAHTAPKDVTGTITAPATAAAPPPAAAAPDKPEVARLPTVEGWVLRDAVKGSALIEGRRGVFEVFAGDNIPGVGRVDAIRKQDGRWVVVTSKGLIVAR